MTPSTMRAVVYDQPREFTVKEVPLRDPEPGEVRLKVVQGGVCGTDLHLHEGGFITSYPLTPGHENVGTVEALGDGVDSFRVGELVAVNPNTTCGKCPACRSGDRLYCPSFGGWGTLKPGGFADYLIVPEEQVFSAEGLVPDVAVFAEPAACAVHGIEILQPRPGTTALVFGTGPTGLLLAQLLASSGAAHVTVASIAEPQLRRAEELGLDSAYLMVRGRLDDDIAELAKRGDGGFDYVIDATGVAQVQERTVELARSGGTVLLYGVAHEDDRIAISPYEVFRRELTIRGSFAEIDTVPAALAALRSGRIRTDGLITHRFGLDDYGAAMDAVRSDDSAHKVVMTP